MTPLTKALCVFVWFHLSVWSSDYNPNCTAEEASDIAHRFRKSGRNDDGSRCPRETWLEAMASIDDMPTKLFVNIGFNKGYNFAVWANLFAPWTEIDSMKWFRAIDKTETYPNWKDACGKCNDCWVKINTSKWSFTEQETSITIIGLDLNEQNVRLVKDVQRYIIEENRDTVNFRKVNITLIHAGGSDKDGEIVLNSCATGDESCSLDSPVNQSGDIDNNGTQSKLVPLLTVEKLITNLDDFEGLSAGGHIVDILMIDAEGFDPLILKGSNELFRQGRVRCVIFEYHGVGPWLTYFLRDIVNEFDKFEMDCYFQGNGRLWPLSGCWNDAYEFHWWSNVMCIKRDDPYHAAVNDFVVRSETQDRHRRRKIESIIQKLKDLGYHRKDIDLLKEKNKLHDLRAAVHFLKYQVKR